jgi:7-cyano-7-deazaguanine synthase
MEARLSGCGVLALLSGGLDSLVGATWAVRHGARVAALTFDYGQRAAGQELRAAQAQAERLGCTWHTLALPWLGELAASCLTDARQALPVVESAADLQGEQAGRHVRALWVPNRNGLFVAIAAAYAEAWGFQYILLGLNREEGACFPDNTVQFSAAATALLGWSTLTRPEVLAPTAHLSKAEIVQLGLELGAPLELIWSCYEGGAAHCWRCPSCVRLRIALQQAGVWPQKAPHDRSGAAGGEGPDSAPGRRHGRAPGAPFDLPPHKPSDAPTLPPHDPRGARGPGVPRRP